MENKKVLLGIFFAVILMNFVFAVPPVTTTQSFSEGYNIQVPQDNILKINQSYIFDFHVFNISNGVPKTSGISCDFHLYDAFGNNLFTGTDSSSDAYGDYTFDISGGNFSTEGHPYYFVRCNSSSFGGFGESILIVNASGRESSDAITIFLYLLIIALTSIMLFSLISIIGKLATFSTNLKDVAFNWSIFFALIITYWFAQDYAISKAMVDLSNMLITITTFSHGVLPLLAFIITLFYKGLKNIKINPQEMFGNRERGDYG